MQYQFKRYQYVKSIEFKNTEPLQNVEKILYFNEVEVAGSFQNKFFRYSWDQITWTNWETLTQSNLSNIVFREEPEFYLEVNYNRADINAGNIQNWYLYFEGNIPGPIVPIDASIDADTLGGEEPDYYLNSANHFGPYPNLNGYNITDGSTAGPYSHKIDTSTGTDLYFKGIIGGAGITVQDTPSNQIIIDVSIEGDNYYENTSPTLSTVGGILAGDSFFSPKKTFAETMDQIFFPLITPEYQNPSTIFRSNVSSLMEVGDNIIINFEVIFNRGQITIQDNFQDYRSGLPNSYLYISPDAGTILSPIDSSVLSDYQDIVYDVSIGRQTWESIVSYDEGPQPKDSKENNYDIPLSDGSTNSKLLTIEGVYPLFATSSNIAVSTKQSLYSMLYANNIELNLVSEPDLLNRQKFFIPKIWTDSRSLAGIETFDTLAQIWSYQGNSAIASLSFWLTSDEYLIVQGKSTLYTRYTYNNPGRGAVKIKLKF